MRLFPYLNLKEFKIFQKLNTPVKIQDFLDKIPMNFESQDVTNRSPLMVLKLNEAHCMEAAMLGAAIFWYHREKPLLLDLRANKDDFDHVAALFKIKNHWGAISKTNHPLLRYRDPVYKNIRELVMSYFNEYYQNNRKKTLRDYSDAFDLRQFDKEWLVSEKDLWHIVHSLNRARHYNILQPGMAKRLRLIDKFELKAGLITEWPKK